MSDISRHSPIGAHIAAVLPHVNGKPIIWRDKRLHYWGGANCRAYLPCEPSAYIAGELLLIAEVQSGSYCPAD